MNLFFFKKEIFKTLPGCESEKGRMIFAIALSFLCAAALHALLFSFGLYGVSADESGRTLDAVAWMRTGKPQSNVWLPMHRMLVAAGMSLYNNCFAVPRILSFLFGLATLLGLILLARELFHRRNVTVVTAFLSAVFGPRVVLSVVPLTEIEYIAFMIFAMLFYMRWIRSAKFSALLASSVFAALGTTVRYEAWIFVFVFLLLLFIEPESRKTLFAKRQLLPIVFLLTCSFPAYWIISSFRENQALLIFVSSHSDRYSVVDPKTILKGIWHNPVTQFIVQNTFSLNVAGMLPAVALFKKDKQLRRFLLLPAISFILFGGIGLTGSELGTHNPWRIAVLWSCLLIPFTAVWVVEQQERFWQYGRTTAVVFVMMFFFLGQLGWLTQKACFTRPRYEAGIFLRDRVRSALGPDEKILIDTRTWDYVDLLVVSNEPERFVLNGGPSPHKQENLVLSPSIPVDLKILAANPYRYLVFETPLLLNAQSAARCEKIFSNEEWTIYKIISHSAE